MKTIPCFSIVQMIISIYIMKTDALFLYEGKYRIFKNQFIIQVVCIHDIKYKMYKGCKLSSYYLINIVIKEKKCVLSTLCHIASWSHCLRDCLFCANASMPHILLYNLVLFTVNTLHWRSIPYHYPVCSLNPFFRPWFL